MFQVWLRLQELFNVLPFCRWGQRSHVCLRMSLEDFLELALRGTRHRTRCSDHRGLFGVAQDRWVIPVEIVVRSLRCKLLQQVWRSIALFRILFLFLHLLLAIQCFLIISVTLHKSHPVAHSFQLGLS